MIRRAAAVALALALQPALVRAQNTVLTVSVASADVYKAPSTGSPIIGHAARGAVLPVTRELGSWVKVAWPDAQDGTGYVHVTMGRVGSPAAGAAAMRTPPSAAAEPPTTSIPPLTHTTIGERVAPRGQLSVTPASHLVGLGGLFATSRSVGATARAWRGNRVGIQAGFMRDAQNSATVPGRMTTMAFEPGVVVALFDRVSDYVWVRPYVGSSFAIRRQTLSSAAPLSTEPVSNTTTGFRVFGGGELTFASMPRFGLSADLGYRRAESPFEGFAADRLGVAIAGHWYVK
jgi:SH3 domain-containing protein